MSTFQPLPTDYADGIFTELGSLEVPLDADPLVYGPKRLNGKIALSRKMTARCERIFLDVSQKLAGYKRALRQAELVLDLEKKNLLANDPETRAGRAVSEREAIATGKLKSEVQAVFDATYAVEELESIMLVVKAKRADLRDVQGRLRDQIRLCQEEIGLGARWGSKSPRGIELEPGQGFADGSDVEDVENLIQNMRAVSDAELHLLAKVDDSDPEEEIEADLASPVEEQDEIPPEESEKIPGEDMVEDFGFVPHCAVCGEKQSLTRTGLVCPNGHGGAESVPPPSSSLPEDQSVPSAAEVLPASVDRDQVDKFLSDTDDAVAKPMSRLEAERVNEDLDIDSILANFEN